MQISAWFLSFDGVFGKGGPRLDTTQRIASSAAAAELRQVHGAANPLRPLTAAKWLSAQARASEPKRWGRSSSRAPPGRMKSQLVQEAPCTHTSTSAPRTAARLAAPSAPSVASLAVRRGAAAARGEGLAAGLHTTVQAREEQRAEPAAQLPWLLHQPRRWLHLHCTLVTPPAAARSRPAQLAPRLHSSTRAAALSRLRTGPRRRSISTCKFHCKPGPPRWGAGAGEA
jgi:hypothetical protein